MRVYRLVLRALPREMRERFGAEMEMVFRERLSASSSVFRRAGVWFRGVGDVVVHGLAVRWGHSFSHAETRRRGGGWLQDVRFAVRGLVRAPGFAAVAITTLALGIGANTAVFSVVNALLLRPLPYAEPERLVSVWPEAGFNVTMLKRVAEGAPALESLTGVSLWTLSVTGDGEPEEISALFVTVNHFDVLGVRPFLGRTFVAEEGEPGRDDVAVLSHAFWQTRYGGDLGIIGRRIGLASPTHATHEVIGVMVPEHRAVLGAPSAWVPMTQPTGSTLATDNTWWVNGHIGRLARGATREQAQTQVRALAPALRAEVPSLIKEEDVNTASVQPLREEAVGGLRGALLVLLGAVGLVLLMACVNVANLLLARGEARRRELALRRALGAGRARLLRQLLTEALVLAVLGGVTGVVTAKLLLRLVLNAAPPDIHDLASVRIDVPVLLFALTVSCGAALIFGAAPAARAGRIDALNVARQGTKGAVGSAGSLGSVLVAVEVALAVILVVGSGLMLRTLSKLHAVDPGFAAEGVLVVRPGAPAARYPDGPAYHRFYAEVLERIRAVPQVALAGGINHRPVTSDNWNFPLYLEDHPVPPGASPPSHNFRVVTRDYFETLRIPLLGGRTFTDLDRTGAPGAAVVNRAFAERYWPREDAVGKELRIFSPTMTPYQIVGVVADVHQHALNEPPRPEVYVPHAQIPWEVALWIVVRARDGDVRSLAPLVRAAVRSVDAESVLAQMEPLEAVIGRSAATTRFFTLALGFFGALALVLGAVGVYGVMSYTVARRLPEFGVRLALGAQSRDVLASALARGALPVVLGVATGSIGAFFATRLMDSLLFGVSAQDPITFAGVALLLSLTALVALLVPAWRATRADATALLRQE